MGKLRSLKSIKPANYIKLDFGCGPNPKEGYEGVDIIEFGDKVKHVLDLTKFPYPFKDGTVSHAHASHFIEHLDATERVKFMNEMYRILKPEGELDIVVPHWCSNRAYGDPTHKWPPISEMWFYYLNKDWRATQAPHTDFKYNPNGFSCNFQANWGYTYRQDLAGRNQEYIQDATMNHKEVLMDTVAHMVKLP